MKKRLLSLIMAVMMVVVLVVPAAAATTDTTSNGTVTVYVTYGMFQNKGIGTYPAYKGGLPTSADTNSNFYIEGVELSISDIQNYYMETTQTVYGVPDTSASYFKSPNLLDAILTAFWTNEKEEYFVDITDTNVVNAGWDSNPKYGNPGGYINSVYPDNTTVTVTEGQVVDGISYTIYRGTGWNIACGTSASNIKALDAYGTSTALTNGMIIVFDYSPYVIYEAE
jgi:hypothetical protein